MNIERMNNLLRVLEEVKAKEQPFDMEWWFAIGGRAGDEMDCNTAACAVGWACRDPWMQSQGLGVIADRPVFGDDSGIEAAAMFFELDEPTAEELFFSSAYVQRVASGYPPVTIDAVIRRVKKVLAGEDLTP